MPEAIALDQPRPEAWTVRQICHHLANVVYYARQIGDLTAADADPAGADTLPRIRAWSLVP